MAPLPECKKGFTPNNLSIAGSVLESGLGSYKAVGSGPG